MSRADGQDKAASSGDAERLTNGFVTADKALCRFLLTIYRERPRWRTLQIDLPSLWKPLCDYERMCAEVTTENAEKVFANEGFLSDDALRNLRRKLDIARQADIDKPKARLKEMKSVLDSVRNAHTQLSYDLADVDLVALDINDEENGQPSRHLRGTYKDIVEDCDCVVQDVSEADSILNSFENHCRWRGAVISSKDLDCIKIDSFSEQSARLICSLRCYIEAQGFRLDQVKTGSGLFAARAGSHQTPKSSRRT